MKLISCHITNFGKLSNFDYNFNDGLNVISERNGWGKTTFADFIRAMFYSLPANRARNLKDNLRKKYKPWNAEIFGGSLIFEVDDKTYRIERTWGSSESEDTFQLYNETTNKLSNDFSSNIGYELFGFDSESFSKTTYLPQLELKIDLTDNISAKLNNLTQDKDDVSSFNYAIEAIDEKRKFYQKSGERGKYYDLLRQNSEIESQKEIFSSLQATVEKLNNDKKNLQTKIENLENKEKELQEKINNNLKWQSHKEVEKIQSELSNIEDEILSIKKSLNNNVPTTEKLNTIRQQSEKLSSLTKEIELLSFKQSEFKSKLDSILDFLGDSELSDEKIQKIQSAESKWNENKNFAPKPAKNYFYILSWVLPVIIVVALSVLFAVNILKIVAYIICVGVISIIGSIFFIISKKHTKRTEKHNIKEETEQDLLNLLNFNFVDGLNIDTKLYIFYEKLKEKECLEKQLSIQADEMLKLEETEENLDEELTSFQNLYSNIESENINDLVFKLSKHITTLEQLSESKQKKDKELSELSKNLESIEFDKSNIEDLSELRENIKGVSSELSVSRNEFSNLNLTLERYEQKLGEIEEFLSTENVVKEELSDAERKLKIYELTTKYLNIAKDELDSAFIKPITENFAVLVSDLNATDISDFKIDTNFNISIVKNGQTKELSFFSKGYQDIAYICARLSSIKAMFKQNKPFIILDDPFVNLDAEKLNLAKTLLKTLSKDYQIIYLICHESRI